MLARPTSIDGNVLQKYPMRIHKETEKGTAINSMNQTEKTNQLNHVHSTDILLYSHNPSEQLRSLIYEITQNPGICIVV